MIQACTQIPGANTDNCCFWRWLEHAPTAFHLFCAERELRGADVSCLPPGLRQARESNLALLRRYGARREFPHNRDNTNHYAPCFIDAAGRQCAVAFLMNCSGAQEAAAKIAQDANCSRIQEMNFPELNAWVGQSGFTEAELARIQPGYPPTPEQIDTYQDFIRLLWFGGALALLSVTLNAYRLLWGSRFRYTAAILGVLCGLFLFAFAYRGDGLQFGLCPELQNKVADNQFVAYGIAVVAIAIAATQFFIRRGV